MTASTPSTSARRRALALLAGCTIGLVAAGTPTAAPSPKPLSVHQDPVQGHLFAPVDRIEITYKLDTPGIKSPTGTLYVRNDSTRAFERLPMTLTGGPALRASVPVRLLRGHELFYYAVVRDPRSGRSVTAAHERAWILQKPVTVNLGAHRFGHPSTPGAVVARTGKDGVAFQTAPAGCGCGPGFGPTSFAVGRDGSVWLDDAGNRRVLVWNPGRPDTVARTVPMPFFADSDLALGPGGTLYVTHGVGTDKSSYYGLARLSSAGTVLWQSRIADPFSSIGVNTALRTGPDGTLYAVVGRPGSAGGEQGRMPVATPAGRAIAPAEQQRRIHWPDQPVAPGLRLLSQVYTPVIDGAPHEARFALVDGKGRLVRSWRVLSGSELGFGYAPPELVGGDPVVVLEFGRPGVAEHVVLRLGPGGTRARLTLPFSVYGDDLFADVRIGPDGNVYRLATSPDTGAVVTRYSLDR